VSNKVPSIPTYQELVTRIEELESYFYKLENLAKDSGETWETCYGHNKFEPEFGMMDDCYGDCDDKDGM